MEVNKFLKEKKNKKKNQKNKKKNKKNKGGHRLQFDFKLNKLVEVCQAVKNQMSAAVLMVYPTASKLSEQDLCSKFLQIKDKNPDLHANYVKLMRNMSQTVFGVWQPKIMMKSGDNSTGGIQVVTTAGSVFDNAIGLASSVLSSIALMWAIFDEYRPVGPFRVFFTPADTSTSRLYGIGVIDYSNSGALTSVTEAMSYDTKQIFDLVPYRTAHAGVSEWSGRVIGQPDLLWVTTGTTATYAYWKTYGFNVGDASWAASQIYGWMTFEMEIEFRQLNQGG